MLEIVFGEFLYDFHVCRRCRLQPGRAFDFLASGCN